METIIIILVVIVAILALWLWISTPPKPDIDKIIDQSTNKTKDEVIRDIVETNNDDYAMMFVNAVVAENVLGDQDFANDLYLRMLMDVFANDAMQGVAEVIGVVDFNDVAVAFDFEPLPNNNFVVKSDANNVHDGNVQEKMVEKYNHLRVLNGKIDPISLEQSLIKEVNALGSIPVATAINKSLHGDVVTSYKDTERNILLHTWNRVKDNPQMKENFFTNLRSAYKVESGNTVCVTGRVSRILDTFTAADSDHVLSGGSPTIDIIRNEMHGRSSKIVNEELGKLTQDELTKYNSGSDEIGTKIKGILDNRLRNEYAHLANDKRINVIIDDIKNAL